MRNLILVLGDQLDRHNSALRDLHPVLDTVLMIEAADESLHVASHKVRTVLFLSAMRHFAQNLASRVAQLDYLALGQHSHPDLKSALIARLQHHRPQLLRVVEPGEYRVRELITQACAETQTPLEFRKDTHFICSTEDFAKWAGGPAHTRRLRMEMFYRRMRRTNGILMDGTEPEGGMWNFDADNRGSFGRSGPGEVPPPRSFPPDTITREVIGDVEKHFPNNPGSLDHFDWPVTREQSRAALDDFIAHRLPHFGRYQDAMWQDEPYLYHSRISTSLNLKLLNPRDAIFAAVSAYHNGHAPIESVEGFVRQILGWREFIRGIYWLDMPGLKEANHFGHQRTLPQWYWTGQTKMRCMAQTVGQTLKYGYAHHIQRLMITGQFALLAGIEPKQASAWYLGMYADAVEWAELPNTAGMALFSNGGRFTTKPYVASGSYVKRMSNYCKDCAYRPDVRHGDNACPVSSLYWHFLDRNQAELARNPRAATMLLSLKRLSDEEKAGINAHAAQLLERLDSL